MDNLFTVFIVLVFVLGPLLEGLKKKEQERKRQEQQRQEQPPPPAPKPLPRSSTEEISTKPRDAAAEMIPDDLWAILTGEQRPAPQVPAPQPRPTKKQPWDVVYIPPEETEDEEEDFFEHVASETRPAPRAPSRWQEGARQKDFDELTSEVTGPTIISLETPVPSAAARHSAFHRKVDQPAPVAVVRQARKEVLGLATRRELQRAFVLQEILGKPRGLE